MNNEIKKMKMMIEDENESIKRKYEFQAWRNT